MENLFYLLFLVPVVVANLGDRDRRWHSLALALLGAINIGLLALAALAALVWLAQTVQPDRFPAELRAANWPAVVLVTLLTSFAAWLPLLPAVRRWLARYIRIDPGSAVHATALAFAIYQVGASLGQAALLGSLEALVDPEFAANAVDVVLSGVWLALLALVGVGLVVRRAPGQVAERLGLLRPTWKQALAAAGVLLLVLALSLGVDMAWQQLDPSSYERIDRVTRNLFGGLTGLGGALALGLSAGIGEELLFRGAVQPRLGLLPTTLLFAVGHLQYGLSLAALQILLIGLALGLLRDRANTTVCIAVHAAYNFLTVLLG